MVKFIITIQSHGFKVKIPFSNLRYVAINFARQFTTYELVFNRAAKRKVLVPATVYATANPALDEFGFLKHDLQAFLDVLKRMDIRDDEIVIKEIPVEQGSPIEFKMPGIEPRANQLPALDFLASTRPTRTLPLPTGQGKTLTTLMALVNKGQRTMFFMNATHIRTWLKTIIEKTNISKKDIMVIQGAEAMDVFVQLAEMGRVSEKIIIASSTTFNKYLLTYIKGSSVTGKSFNVPPESLMAKAGVGLCVVDEAHEVLQQVVRRVIMLNVPQWIFLSATLKSNRDTINRIYESIFPMEDQFKEYSNNDHVTVHPTYYRLLKPNDVQCNGPQGYSHNMYETYILKRPKMRKAYFDMIYDRIFAVDYLKNRKPGTKCLFFFSSIAGAEAFGSYLGDRLNQSIPYGVYHSKVPPKVKELMFEEAEIFISTPKSMGTGTDIPNLTCAIMTQAVASRQLAQQIQGRTRQVIAYPDESPRFHYLSCMSIPKHMMYDHEHIKDFSDKSKAVIPNNLGVAI